VKDRLEKKFCTDVPIEILQPNLPINRVKIPVGAITLTTQNLPHRIPSSGIITVWTDLLVNGYFMAAIPTQFKLSASSTLKLGEYCEKPKSASNSFSIQRGQIMEIVLTTGEIVTASKVTVLQNGNIGDTVLVQLNGIERPINAVIATVDRLELK
jgi:hypothetical protein